MDSNLKIDRCLAFGKKNSVMKWLNETIMSVKLKKKKTTSKSAELKCLAAMSFQFSLC